MSKYKKYATDEGPIFPHKHCPRCNAMMAETEQYCSEACITAATAKRSLNPFKFFKRKKNPEENSEIISEKKSEETSEINPEEKSESSTP